MVRSGTSWCLRSALLSRCGASQSSTCVIVPLKRLYALQFSACPACWHDDAVYARRLSRCRLLYFKQALDAVCQFQRVRLLKLTLT